MKESGCRAAGGLLWLMSLNLSCFLCLTVPEALTTHDTVFALVKLDCSQVLQRGAHRLDGLDNKPTDLSASVGKYWRGYKIATLP